MKELGIICLSCTFLLYERKQLGQLLWFNSYRVVSSIAAAPFKIALFLIHCFLFSEHLRLIGPQPLIPFPEHCPMRDSGAVHHGPHLYVCLLSLHFNCP